MTEAGVRVGGHCLAAPHTTSIVRVREGKTLIQDGPNPETKEMLGGICVIDVPDLDTALAWAARSPAARYASLEVRPILACCGEDVAAKAHEAELVTA